MQQLSKIGIGVITHNRTHLFRKCISSVPEVDHLVVVNDGEPYPASVYPSRVAELIQHRRNEGVGRSKNDALRYLLNAGCSDIFLVEDDIRIVDPHICQAYVRASRRTGIRHFNFAYHGFENRLPQGTPAPPRKTITYDNGVVIGLHRNILGAFQYFTHDVLRDCGLMDPLFINMFEHVEHTYRIIQHGFHPPFWWFADLSESDRCFEDLDPNHELSTIRSERLSYRFRLRISDMYFAIKHSSYLANIKDVDEDVVDRALANIQSKFGNSGAG